MTVLIVVLVLYFARIVLIPVALAILFSFLLGPVVVRFRNWGFGPATSASIVVGISLLIAASVGALLVTQLADLASQLPVYQQNVQKKIESIRESGGGVVNKVARIVYQINEQLKPPSPEAVGAEQAEKPVPVEIRGPAFSPMQAVQKVIGSLLHVGVTAAIVVVFVLFMLIQRQDLRDRVVRLAGSRRINRTTTLLDDAARRVSRFLLAQLLLNSSYGLFAGIGLYFIGIPNPVLWGIITMLLRYVPYLGIWIAALLPGAVAFAIEPGWSQLLMIFGLYFGIDLIMYNLAEPLVYGSSTGLSPIAVLITTVFWTWLWGPVGLLLATPLTVCVVVLGRHVPQIGFLSVLLSDEKPLTDATRFYQRMLAMDVDEASAVAEEVLAHSNLENVYDSLLVPALSMAEEESHEQRLDPERFAFFVQNTRMIAEELAERSDEFTQLQAQKRGAAPLAVAGELSPGLHCKVICLPARDQADELGAFMLMHLLKKRGIEADTLSSSNLAAESVQVLRNQEVAVACVCSIPPIGYRQARYLCHKIRTELPGFKIVGAVLTEGDVTELRQRQPPLQADELATTLTQALASAISLAAIEQPNAERAVA
jgi:predicted PurR-regulated permease PerM